MIDISPADEMIVNAILKKHVAKCEVRAFGSRHKWTAKSYSDLDLAIVGTAKLDKSVIYALQEAFEESELSFRVDVLDWYAISDEFRQIIEQGYTVIQEKDIDNQLPAGWDVKKLGDIVEITSSKRIFAKEYVTHGIPFYRGKEIIEKHRNNKVSTEIFITQARFDEIKNNYGVPERGDLLLTSVGTLGIPYVVKEDEIFYFKDGNLTWFKKWKGLHNQFLYYWFKSEFGINAISKITIGSTQQAITIQALSSLEINLPLIEEQKEIAAILSSIDDKIKLNRQTNQTLEEIAQSIFNYYFMNSDYKIHPLSELIDFNPSYKVPNPNSVAYLEMANINANSYRATNWCYRKSGSGAKFKNGDTLFARITPCLENGKTCFVDFLADSEIAYGSTEYIVMRSKDQFHPFLSYLIAKNQNFRNYAINTMTGTSGRQRAQADKLAHFEIHLPPSELITSIHSQLESITSKLKNTSEQIEALINIRDALLPKLISGEVNISVGKHL